MAAGRNSNRVKVEGLIGMAYHVSDLFWISGLVTLAGALAVSNFTKPQNNHKRYSILEKEGLLSILRLLVEIQGRIVSFRVMAFEAPRPKSATALEVG